jgi:cytosine deaminase
MSDLLLRDGVLADRRRVDVVISGGWIAEVLPAAQVDRAGAESVDLGGRLLLPAVGEPHAHLDKAFTADTFPNPAGDLSGAIEAVMAGWEITTVGDIVERAHTAARKLVASGTTAIRTHTDVTAVAASRSMEALVEVRHRLQGVCEIQIVALGFPLTGPEGAAGRRSQEQAIAAGADLVGGAPHLEEDPAAAIAFALDLAAGNDLAVDLHLDEVLDPSVQHLAELARQTAAAGMGGRVTASHCVSHGLLTPEEQRSVGRMLADVGVSVVTLPRTNLFLQSRRIEQATPRGLAGIRALLDTGVTMAAGADNLQDPFYIIGRSDPLETASFLVAAAHLTVAEAFDLVTAGVRNVMGLQAVRIEAGQPAELFAVAAASVREAIAEQPPDRLVIHQGRVVARTTTETWMATG